MAEIKDKVVTVESLSALHEYNKETFATIIDFSKLQSMIGYDSIDNYTLALDDNGKIIWETSDTSIGAGSFFKHAMTASIFIIGKNVTNISGAFASHTNVRYIYLYPDNEEVIIPSLTGSAAGLQNTEAKWFGLNKNYTYLIDLLIAIGIPNSIIPIKNGGTNSSDGATGLANLFAAGETVLSSYQYGDELPPAGTKGRVFFKRVIE